MWGSKRQNIKQIYLFEHFPIFHVQKIIYLVEYVMIFIVLTQLSYFADAGRRQRVLWRPKGTLSSFRQ